MGILVKASVKAKQSSVKHYLSFEHSIVKLPLAGKKFMILIAIYRLSWVPVTTFLDEFSDLLDLHTISIEHFVIAGDINIHAETDSHESNKLKELLDIYDLKQHITEATHRKGHTLDVVMTPNREPFLKDAKIVDIDLSDHFLVDFSILCSPVETRQMKTITSRSMAIDMVRFGQEVKERLSALPATNSILSKINCYNTTMFELVREYAPIKTKEINIVPEAP